MIGVVLDDLLGLGAVFVVDALGDFGADAQSLQVDQDVAHGAVLGPGIDQIVGQLGLQAFDFVDALRLFIEDLHGLVAEVLKDLLGGARTDAADDAAAEIIDDAFFGLRGDGHDLPRPELPPVTRVFDPFARELR